MDNQRYDLYVRTLTPLHIGGEQEKHLIKDFDYFEEARQGDSTVIWSINERKVIDSIGVDGYVHALEQGKGKLKEALQQRGLKRYDQFCNKLGEIEGSGMQLHKMISEGRTGMPYLPGTSFKGGLRSALFVAAGGNKTNNQDYKVFGEYDNSAMRFVQVSDVYFNHSPKLYNTRVYNAQNNRHSGGWEGSWKFELRSGRNEDKFSGSGFATTLATVPPDALGALRLSIRSADLERYQGVADDEQRRSDRGEPIYKQAKRVPKGAAEMIVVKKPLETIFQKVYRYTNNYLSREIEFFQKLGGDMSDRIIARLQSLQQANKSETPVLRIGYGSGYHSVTGDYQAEDHFRPLDKPLKIKGKDLRAKSRRLAFDWDEAAEEYRFWPLGFVQLMDEAAASTLLKSKITAKSATPTPEAVQKLTLTPTSQKTSSELARKSPKQLKRGAKVLAIVKGTQGNMVNVTPLLEGYTNNNLAVTYPAGVATGKTVEITVMLQGKNLVAQRGLKIIE